MSISVAQCRAARGLIGWSQGKLAEESRVSASAIANFENGRTTPVPNNLDALRRAFEAAGVQFIPQNGGGAGVRLRDRCDATDDEVAPGKAQKMRGHKGEDTPVPPPRPKK